MNNNTKRRLKNTAKTLGKGAKFVGKSGLKLGCFAGNLVFNAAEKIAGNDGLKEIIALGVTLGTTAMFSSIIIPTLVLMEVAKYGYDKLTGNNINIGSSIKTMLSVGRNLATIPTELLAGTISEISKVGEKVTKKGLDITR